MPLILRRILSRFALISGLALVIAAVAWLMFGVAGYRKGMMSLPSADGSQIEVLVDARVGLNFVEVAEMPDEAWRAWKGETYLVGKAGREVWLRITLRNPTLEPLAGVLADSEYLPDRVDAWVGPAGIWRQLSSGEAVSGKDKPLWGRTAAFPVTVPAEGRAVVFLRVMDYYDVYLWLRWWPQASDFFQAQIRDTLAESICYGAMMALLIYNLVLWLRLRFPDTGCYVLYAAAMGVFNLTSNGGLALLGLGLGSPGKEILSGGVLALSGVFLVQFARMFLGTAVIMPGVDRWLYRLRLGLTMATVSAVVVPWIPAPRWFDAIVAMITLTHLLLLAVALLAWKRGARHARYFVAAFGLLFTGAAPAVVAWLGQDMQAWAAMALLGGSLMEILLLSFALADRFAQTQRQLVEETEQRRLIEETYADELEIEVRERTRELEQANADKDRMLAVIGHDLRSPLTGLMRTADETSGEFAREASRIARALLLLIEDLVLWARLRAGMQAQSVHGAEAVTVPAVALHRTLADRARIELVASVPDGLQVETDLVLAQTLVRNLLANALKFASTRVELRAEPAPDGGVRFCVRNDGASLPDDVTARFGADVDEPLSATGGLGLRLCREICRVFGTRLVARSMRGGGTEFSFVLKSSVSRPLSFHE